MQNYFANAPQVGASFRGQDAYNDLFSTLGTGYAVTQGHLQQAAEQGFRARAEGIQGGFNQYQSNLTSQMAAQGLDPAIGQRMVAEQSGYVPAQMAQARGESAAGYQQALAGLTQQFTEGQVSLGQARKQTAMGLYLEQKNRKMAKRSQDFQMLNSVAGLGMTAVGIGAMGGFGSLGGLFGGGRELLSPGTAGGNYLHGVL